MPHIHQLYDFAVSIYIVHNSKVLLVHHPRYAMWLPVGGHIELDEDPEQAIHREVQEETGLAIRLLSDRPNIVSKGTKFLSTPNYLDVHEANLPHRHIGLTYFAVTDSDQHQLSAEHSEINWLGLDDLDNPKYQLSNAVKFYCRQAIELSKTFEL